MPIALKNSGGLRQQELDIFSYDRRKYRKFVLNNSDYQKVSEVIKYAEKW